MLLVYRNIMGKIMPQLYHEDGMYTGSGKRTFDDVFDKHILTDEDAEAFRTNKINLDGLVKKYPHKPLED